MKSTAAPSRVPIVPTRDAFRRIANALRWDGSAPCFRLFSGENFHFVDVQACFHDGLEDRSRILLTPLSPYRTAPDGLRGPALAACMTDGRERLFFVTATDFRILETQEFHAVTV